MDTNPPKIARRKFLDLLLGGGLATIVVAILYPVWEFIRPPKGHSQNQNTAVAATKGELAPNSGKVFRIGSTAGILIRTPEGGYRAFSATCTHLACTVQYRPDLGHIWCACHEGLYDLTGKNVAGPPPRPLEPYRVDLQGNEIVVSRRIS